MTVGVFGPGDSVPLIDESLSSIAEGDTTRIASAPELKVTFYNLCVNIHKGQDIPILGGIANSLEPFVTVRHSATKERTKTIKDPNPDWNTTIRLPSYIPCHDGNIIVELWNGETNGTLINSIVFDFFELIKNELTPRWFNFYWRSGSEGVLGAVQNIIGSDEAKEPNAYGGRLLISASANKVQVPHAKGQAIARPISEPSNLEFHLWMDLYEAASNKFAGNKIRIELVIGPHSLLSLPLIPNELGTYLVDQSIGSFEELLLYLPESEESEQWDAFLYLLTEPLQSSAAAAVGWLGGVSLPQIGMPTISFSSSSSWQRVAWVRVPLSTFMNTRGRPQWYTLNSVDSTNAGALLAAISLFNQVSTHIARPERLIYTLERFYFRAYIYEGLHLPSIAVDTFPNPYLKIILSGHTIRTSIIKSTLNPAFYEAYEIELMLPANINLAPDIQIEVYSRSQSMVGGDIALGSCSYLITKVPVEWKKAPEWMDIKSKEFPMCKSKLLMGFELISAEKVEDETYPFFDDIRPSTKDSILSLLLVGVRMYKPMKSPSVTLSFGRDVDDSSQPLWYEIVNRPISGNGGNWNFLKYFNVNMSLPKRSQHNAFLEVKVEDQNEATAFSGGSKTVKGVAYIPLNHLFPWLTDYEKNESLEYFHLKMLEDVIIEEAEQILKDNQAKENSDKTTRNFTSEESQRASKMKKSKVNTEVPYNDPELANCVISEKLEHVIYKNKSSTNIVKNKDTSNTSLGLISIATNTRTREDTYTEQLSKRESVGSKFGLDPNLLDFELKIVEDDKFEEEQRDEIPYELEIDFSPEDLPYLRVPIFRCTASGVPETVGYLKYVCTVTEGESKALKAKLDKHYDWLVDQYTKTRDLIVRAYILQAKGLVPLSGASNITTYVWIKNSEQMNILPGGISHNVRDSANSKRQSFRPEFNKCYQLSCTLPDHALVEVSIMILGTISDECIGKTFIDMEDRYFNHKFQKMILDDATPIELRSLKNEGSSISHGTLRGWFELMTEEFAQKNPAHTMNISEPDDFQLRVVIWRVKAVPLGDNSQISLYIKGSYQPEEGSEIIRNTDTHYNSKDGAGVFNWRFLYDIKLPTRSTTIKLTILSYDFISSGENLGECTFDLASDFFKARQRGTHYRIPKLWLNCSHPAFKGKTCGAIEVEFSIIPKKEAELAPVGSGRDEPNRDPFLPNVTENRTYIDWTAIGETIASAGSAILSGLKWTGVWLVVALIIGIIIFIIILIK